MKTDSNIVYSELPVSGCNKSVMIRYWSEYWWRLAQT